MYAIRHRTFGPPDVLVVDELPDLEPGAGEARIAVHASGVHLLDTTLRRGEADGSWHTSARCRAATRSRP